MKTLSDRPLSEEELRELIRSDNLMATMSHPSTGEFIVRNADARREYEIRVVAMKYYLKNVKWLNPN